MIAISNEQIQEICHFVRKSVYDLKQLTPNHDLIIVAMPTFMDYFLGNAPKERYWELGISMDDQGARSFYGMKVQPHFLSEIVVFYSGYYYQPDLFKPKTFTIKFAQ